MYFTITGVKKIFRYIESFVIQIFFHYTEDFVILGFVKGRFHFSTCLRDNRARSKIFTTVVIFSQCQETCSQSERTFYLRALAICQNWLARPMHSSEELHY